MNTSGTTEIVWHSYSNTYYWTVRGFTERMTDKIESPEFHTYRDGDTNAAPFTPVTFKLELSKVQHRITYYYTLDLVSYPGEDYSVFPWAENGTIKVEYKIRIGKDNSHMATIADNSMMVKKGTTPYCSRFAIYKSFDDYCLLGGEFIVSCDLVHYHYTIETVDSNVRSEAPVHPRNNIQPGLYHMYTDGTLTDVEIRVDGDTIKAHKVILAAHSPVFKTMLQSDFTEKATNTITIEDVGKKAFLVVLDFLYGEAIDRGDIDFNTVVGMLHTAEKYDISSMKKVCEREMVKHITVSNIADILAICDKYDTSMKKACEQQMATQITVDTVMELLIISDKCDANSLKQRCYEFIYRNKKVILNTMEWEALVHGYPRIICDYMKKFG